MIQIFITGLGTSGLVTSIYILLLDLIPLNIVINTVLRYVYAILAILAGIPFYRHIYKLRIETKIIPKVENQAELKVGREVYLRVLSKKWHILLLTGGFYKYDYNMQT